MSDIVQGQNGGCFYCGKMISHIKRVLAQYDNGEPTTIVIGVCKDCEAKK